MSSISIETRTIDELPVLGAVGSDEDVVIVRMEDGSGTKQLTIGAIKRALAGNMSALDTLDKESLVGAINEVYGMADPDYFNEGRDLTVLFADEIANYDNAWEWMQARLDAHNLIGIREGDYIPITVSAETYHMQIAGINTYLGGMSGAVKPHIDWISKEVYSQTVQWNTTNNNNGTADVKSPFKASNLYSFLNNTLYPLLPAAVKAVIKPKQIYGPIRYSTASLTDDNSWESLSFDKLWVPYEAEIWEQASWSTKGFGTAAMVVYKLFANSLKARLKATPSGGLSNWWTASAYSGIATYAVYVSTGGMSDYNYASGARRVPICFRQMAQA